jgi:DNA-binding transcriptional ArsR family regulator
MVSGEAKTTGELGGRVLRLHFTADDLLRTRFAAAPAPLVEMSLALAALQRRDTLFDNWRRESGARLPRVGRTLLQLVPPSAASPLFLDPISDGLDDGLDTVLSSPGGFVRRELRRICSAGQPITPWIRALDERDPDAWRLLGAAVRSAHGALVEPAWSRVWQSFRGEVAWRGRLIGESGLMAALETLHPAVRWRDTTLEIDTRRQYSVRLAGRGVTLLPSAFLTTRPLVGAHPDGSILVVYPALTALPLVEESPVQEPLAELLGRTRAAVLGLAAEPRTTGQLARELGISAASASEHARTLRAAGLLVTERAGKAVLHSRTSLGDRLIGKASDARSREEPRRYSDERSREEPRRRDAARAEGAERSHGSTRAKRAVETRIRPGRG